MAPIKSIVERALQKALPQDCCLVPESRQEITTEGGLNVAGQGARIGDAVKALAMGALRGILVTDPALAGADLPATIRVLAAAAAGSAAARAGAAATRAGRATLAGRPAAASRAAAFLPMLFGAATFLVVWVVVGPDAALLALALVTAGAWITGRPLLVQAPA